jgi:hypothetical protein
MTNPHVVEDITDAAGVVQPHEPAPLPDASRPVRDCACGTEYFVCCAYCGEPLDQQHAHDACRDSNGELEGWDKGQCEACEQAERRAEADRWYDLNGHGYRCNCGCNGH